MSLLLPTTVAFPGAYVIVADVLELEPLVGAVLLPGVLLLLPLVAAVLLLEVSLEPLPQAATTSPAATITAIAGCREQLRSKPISFPLRLVEADGDHVEVARALSLGIGHGNGALIRLRRHRVDLHELGCLRLVRRERVDVA
jgi:hypothetical protein